MKLWLNTFILVLLGSSYCFSQDPMPVLSLGWERMTQKAGAVDAAPISPARAVLPEDKYFQRKAREQRTDSPLDPNKDSMDARSAIIDKAIQESRTPKTEDVNGYSYKAQVRNDSGKTVKVIFWEYRFTEIAHPANFVRRQFLCGVNVKKGEKIDLWAFSLFGPSDTITVENLARSTEKLFDEKAQINRIEFSDDTVIQRKDWKYDDVRSTVERATSTPWGKEMCRGL